MRKKGQEFPLLAGGGGRGQTEYELVSDLKGYPHAFVIGCVVDRQIPAGKAWAIPYKLKGRIGSFEFAKLRKMKKEEWFHHFQFDNRNERAPLHRFNKTMSGCVYHAIKTIGDVYGGDASKMWSGKPSSATVVYRFLQIHGVGQKIATMAANILVRNFNIKFKDYCSIDVSVDVHIKRVFYRLGLTEKGAASKKITDKARGLHPNFPGILDFPCWQIGKNWCTPRNPKCKECYMNQVCPTAETSGKR